MDRGGAGSGRNRSRDLLDGLRLDGLLDGGLLGGGLLDLLDGDLPDLLDELDGLGLDG
ncbi:MAG: hypothetical protein M3R38_17990 [Actinomycetota bacterium]|nr:hypothetical protein [Actinomycetota bacterium]